MSWADLEWPNLSPEFPEPVMTRPAPQPPDVPDDVAERVRVAERRRAAGVRLCVLVGAGLCCAAFVVYAVAARTSGAGDAAAAGGASRAPAVALALLGAGLAVAFPLAALAALWLGPTWEQRRQHWRFTRWQREYARWLGLQRMVYRESLPAERRAVLSRQLRERAQQAAP